MRKLEYCTDLNDLLFDEYFRLVARGREMSDCLKNLILNEGNHNILIILDGLDEAQGWPQEKRILLKGLMSRSVVIITSRSYDTDVSSIDLELEALGLNWASVEAYLENPEIVPNSTAREIRGFIESNPFIKEMVQVPIHLDILCYSWDELRRQKTSSAEVLGQEADDAPTITALYEAVVHTLWRKDIPGLVKVDHGEPVTIDIVNSVQDTARLERLVYAEGDLLGKLAINMMESDHLEFTDKDIRIAIRSLETNGTHLPLSLERNLRKVSLLRSLFREDLRGYRYSFIHLTFQEFFAARYLAHNRDHIKTHLRKHKYNHRYEIVWRFVAGLISNTEDLNFFFDLLEAEPRDLIGVQHTYLTMYCLSESQHQIEPSRRDTIKSCLAEWLQLEVALVKGRGVCTSMAFPEKIVFDLLFQEFQLPVNGWKKELGYRLNMISGRKSLSENFIRNILQLLKEYGLKGHIRHISALRAPVSRGFLDEIVGTMRRGMDEGEYAVQFLIGQPKLPETTISFLLHQIQQATKLEGDALNILVRQRLLSEGTIATVCGWLRGGNGRLRSAAQNILSHQAMLAKETVDLIIEVSTLEDHYCGLSNVRPLDISSLLWRRKLHPETITKILDLFVIAAHRKSYYVRAIADILRYSVLEVDAIERLGAILQQSIHMTRDPQSTGGTISLNSTCSPDNSLALGAVSMNGSRSRQHWVNREINILFILEHNSKLTTNILRIILQLFRDENLQISNAALRILREQSCLDPDIIDELRELFKYNQLKAIRALKGRAELLDGELYAWLMKQITGGPDATISPRDAVTHLEGHSNLPNDLMEALPELMGSVGPDRVGALVNLQGDLGSELITAFVEHYCFVAEHTWGTYKLSTRPEFIEPLITAMSNAEGEDVVRRVAWVLAEQRNLNPQSTARLGTLLTTEPTSSLNCIKVLNATRVLCQQSELSTDIILALHDILIVQRKQMEGTSYEKDERTVRHESNERLAMALYRFDINIQKLWKNRHIGQFCTNLESFDSGFTRTILRHELLMRPVEELTPAYIHGDTLWFYGMDGKLKSQPLRNEKAFRKNFRKVQEEVGVPEWACIRTGVSRNPQTSRTWQHHRVK